MNSQIIPAMHSSLVNLNIFTTKAEYLEFVRQWKHAYKVVSLGIRQSRHAYKLGCVKTPARIEYFTKSLAAIARQQSELGASEYCEAHLRRRFGIPAGPREATWLLALRAQAKIVAGEHRAKDLAAAA